MQGHKKKLRKSLWLRMAFNGEWGTETPIALTTTTTFTTTTALSTTTNDTATTTTINPNYPKGIIQYVVLHQAYNLTIEFHYCALKGS